MNRLPILSNKADEGYFRRIWIFIFEAHFTQEQINSFDKNKLLTEEARNYWVTVALKEYVKIMSTRELANKDESEWYLDMYRGYNNSVDRYLLSDEIKGLFANDNKVKRSQMYKHYDNWCKGNGYVVKGKKSFNIDVRDREMFKEGKVDGIDYYYMK